MPNTPEPDNLAGLLIATIVVLAGVIVFLFRLYVTRNTDTEKRIADKDKTSNDAQLAYVKDRAEADGLLERERAEYEAQLEKERTEWEASEEKLRADHERHLKEKAESYACELVEMSDKFMAREDSMRKDFGDRVERIAAEAAKAAHAQNEVLQKIYERFVGPRRNKIG